ncbi:MAG TPA: ABC transporter substrate-binding protein [Hydrogenophaga sp.]|jgi:peptide/nickel transport system substrate-binding protein|nr:ABC transporter substrate-binding protein [Hydrogenophaga sp.]HBU19228.1 ABC transporter substrate-binding protein [Hydrogenophaga sp.]
MMMKLGKKSALTLAALAMPLVLTGCANVLRVAPHAELKVFDPVWTTAYITRNHGYLIYDTLFAMDENFEPKPQMVEKWTVSPDNKTWTFTLREGQKWHDGTDVTAEDCVASLQRWSKRDGAGQQLFRDVESLTAQDARSFTLKLREPNGQVLQILAKVSANVPFMMPKAVAATDPFTPITSKVGSGPYRYSWAQSRPFVKTVYLKNNNYVPRAEPLSMTAGSKAGQADRIEWIYHDTQEDMARSLIRGKVDYVESPSARVLPLFEGKKKVVVNTTDPLGNIAMARFNMLQPPFDNVAVRRAALMVMQQEDYMRAALGDPKYWRTCYSIFPCGTPLSNDAGSAALKAPGLDAARKALQDARYDGTPVVILNPVDSPVISALTQVTAEKLRAIGMTVQVQDMPWAELTQRRVNRGPVKDGGWSMFHTWWLAGDLLDPSAIAYSGDPETGWFGWLKDAELEAQRAAFSRAMTSADRKAAAEKVQQRIVDDAALGILGQFFEPVAYSSKISGITSPIQFYWQMWTESPFMRSPAQPAR